MNWNPLQEQYLLLTPLSHLLSLKATTVGYNQWLTDSLMWCCFCLMRPELPFLSFPCRLTTPRPVGITSPSQSGEKPILSSYLCEMNKYLFLKWKLLFFPRDHNMILLILHIVWKTWYNQISTQNKLARQGRVYHWWQIFPKLCDLAVAPRPSSQHSSQVVRWVESLIFNIKTVDKVGRWMWYLRELLPCQIWHQFFCVFVFLHSCFVSFYVVALLLWSPSLIQCLALVMWNR